MTFDSKQFRAVLGRFPTGVTVVTGADADGPMGFTIGSFTSVSLDPPLVGFLPMIGSTTWAAIEREGYFCVNVLASDQTDLCWRFARNAADPLRFDGVDWRPGATGAPVIDGALAAIECAVVQVHDVGDHHFVVGEVLHLATDDDVHADHGPLIFYSGSLGTYLPA